MQNKALKKELIENGTLTEYRKRSYALYQLGLDFEERERILKEEFKDFKALNQLMRARLEQKKKVLKQIRFYIERDYKIYFLTLTIKDEVLNTVDDRYLKRRAIEALENADDFSINIDFGTDTERMHWHGIYFSKNGLKVIKKEKHKTKKGKFIEVLKVDDKPLNNYAENTGNITIQEIKKGTEECVSRYLSKITMHSIKVKQRYISTRKGSEYNQYKKNNKKINYYESLNYDIYSLPDHILKNSKLGWYVEERQKKVNNLKNVAIDSLDEETQEFFLNLLFN